jgi:homoserine/homoserine lactone efflux protein
MSVHTVLLYFLTWFLLALPPGPAVLCVMSQASRYGLWAGFMGILGIQIGNFIFFLCVAFGLAALLAAATNAFAILQLAGAGYLFYLGIRVISSSLRRKSLELQSPPQERNLIWQELAIQLTNPKALLFVSALLPQFVDQDGHVMFQLAILLGCSIVVDTAVLGSYALLAERGIRAFRSSSFSRWLECAFDAALVVFGMRLLQWRR